MELLKELVEDWKAGRIGSYSAMIVVAMTVAPEKVPEEAIRWARETILERGE